MKKVLSISVLMVTMFLSTMAFAGTNAAPSTNNNEAKEGDELKKNQSPKYTFTLFNFFNSNTTAKTDTSSVKEKLTPEISKSPVKSSL